MSANDGSSSEGVMKGAPMAGEASADGTRFEVVHTAIVHEGFEALYTAE